MKARILTLCFVLLAIQRASPARALQQASSPSDDVVRQRFSVFKNGDFLIVPVHIGDHDYSFVVDTGAALTIFSERTPVGDLLRVSSIRTPEDRSELRLHECPEARLGDLPLDLPFVGQFPLQNLEEGSGRSVDGVLGMDFLGRHIVHIDLAQGELSLLRSVPPNAGSAVPIVWTDETRPPAIRGAFEEGREYSFTIDTGFSSPHSGLLESRHCRDLRDVGVLSPMGSSLGADVIGRSTRTLYRGKRIVVAGHEVPSLILSESRNSNVLGLGFWSRFSLTLDFPNRTAYVRRGPNFDRPDRWNGSGMHLSRRGDRIYVSSIDAGGNAEKAGIRADDVVIRVAGVAASPATFAQCRSALCDDGSVEIVLLRDGSEHKIMLRLRL